MIMLNKETRDQLLELYRTKRIYLEGNILKLIDDDPNDTDFNNYICEYNVILNVKLQHLYLPHPMTFGV